MFFQNNDLIFEVINVTKIKRKHRINKSFNNRNYYSLSIRIDGNASFESEDTSFCITPKDILFIPPNISYFQSTENETIIAIHFIAYNYHAKGLETLSLEDESEIKDLFLQIYNVWSQKRNGYKYKCTSIFYDILFNLNQKAENEQLSSSPSFKKIINALDYIHSNFKNEQIQIKDLAKMSYLSETQFRKIFKSCLYISPNKYINGLRLETSTQLLQSGLYTISEVAHKSGFTDVKYFSKAFKSKYSVSPKDFINKYKYF